MNGKGYSGILPKKKFCVEKGCSHGKKFILRFFMQLRGCIISNPLRKNEKLKPFSFLFSFPLSYPFPPPFKKVHRQIGFLVSDLKIYNFKDSRLSASFPNSRVPASFLPLVYFPLTSFPKPKQTRVIL